MFEKWKSIPRLNKEVIVTDNLDAGEELRLGFDVEHVEMEDDYKWQS